MSGYDDYEECELCGEDRTMCKCQPCPVCGEVGKQECIGEHYFPVRGKHGGRWFLIEIPQGGERCMMYEVLIDGRYYNCYFTEFRAEMVANKLRRDGYENVELRKTMRVMK